MTEQNFRFGTTDKVAHIENLGQLMVVLEIKRKTVYQSTGEPDESGKGFKKIPKSKIDGILVYWFEGEEGKAKVYKEKVFHSELLVPWKVAQQGKESAEQWIEEKQKQKNH